MKYLVLYMGEGDLDCDRVGEAGTLLGARGLRNKAIQDAESEGDSAEEALYVIYERVEP